MDDETRDQRRKAVVLLLGDFLSYIDRPRSTSDTLAAKSGFAPGRSVPCPACQARGRMVKPGRACTKCLPRLDPKREPIGSTPDGYVPIRHGCKPCLNCKGTGWKRVHVPKGDMGTNWDEYGGMRVSSREPARDTKPWERERETARHLRHVDRLLASWESPETQQEGWERRREAQWRSGSFDALAKALLQLERVAPRRFSLLWRVYVLEQPITLTSAMKERLGESVWLLEPLMPTPILLPAHLNESMEAGERKRGLHRAPAKLRTDRDHEIRRLRFDEGWKINRLAREFHLSEWSIKMICRPQSVGTATVAA